MTDPTATGSYGMAAVRVARGGLNCDEVQERLADFIEQALLEQALEEDGGVRLDSSISQHLDTCPRCAAIYIDLLDLMTAPQVRALQEALIEPAAAPGAIAGLQALWERQVGACLMVDDVPGLAAGLSVVGMIRRHRGQLEDAVEVHKLALKNAEEADDLVSRAISYADLGYLALRDGRPGEARRYLEQARTCAAPLMDEEAEVRVAILLADALWNEARASYEAAHKKASGLSYVPGQRVAQTRLQTLEGSAAGGVGRPFRVTGGPAPRSRDLLVRAPVDVGQGAQAWLASGGLAAAPAGEWALILNTHQRALIEWVQGPVVDQAGEISLAVKMDPGQLVGRITADQEFTIDALFVPTGEPILARRVTPQDRPVLRGAGLQLQGRHPAADDEFLAELGRRMDQLHTNYLSLPREFFALRIWWQRTPQPM